MSSWQYDLHFRADQLSFHPGKNRGAHQWAGTVALALSWAEPWPGQHFYFQSEVGNLNDNKYQRILVLLSSDACFILSEMLFR